MVKLTPRRRWRGPPLGGPLQRGCRFCFAAHDGEVTTSTLAEWIGRRSSTRAASRRGGKCTTTLGRCVRLLLRMGFWKGRRPREAGALLIHNLSFCEAASVVG